MINRAITELDSLAAIHAVGQTLQRMDTRLMDHGERVAYIACELMEEGGLPLDEEKLFLLSVFHDIGAYKTDEIDRMVEFETENVTNHAVYWYLFLKHMSPLSDMAGAILYHHTPWKELEGIDSPCRDYAALIHLADRIDIAHLHRNDQPLFRSLISNSARLFKPEYVQLAIRCFENRRLFECLENESYRNINDNRIKQFCVCPKTALEYLKMLAFAIDFRSEYTVTHTVNTVSIALDLAKQFRLNEHAQDMIYLGALLHDVGKVAIPVDILEHPGRLSPEEMQVMRTHVAETEQIIHGIVPEEICQIAIRHHEKLDGSGYPHGLRGDALSMEQRIVAVADIVSALVSKRSYKEPFPKEKTIAILRDMQGAQLDGTLCAYVCDHYDDIMQETDSSRNGIIQKYQAMLDEYARLKTETVPQV